MSANSFVHLVPFCGSLSQPVVFFHDLFQAVVRDCIDCVAVSAGHCFGRDHGVDDGFFSCLDGGCEDRVDAVVWQHLQGG